MPVEGTGAGWRRWDAFLDEPPVQKSLPFCIVACLAVAFVWTWSIGIVPMVPVQQDVGSRPEHNFTGYVVDCGSGKVAIYKYSVEREAVQEIRKTSGAVQLATIMQGGVSLRPLWDVVDPAVKAGGHSPIFWGATAGLRNELRAGRLAQADVDMLEDEVRSHFASHDVHFEILTGQREASLELAAVKFAFSDLADDIGAITADDLGSFSGGGKSCQIAWGNKGHFVMLDLDIFAAQDVVSAVGEAEAFKWWKEEIHQKTSNAWSRDLGGEDLDGAFIGITMMASAAALAGFDRQILSRDQVIDSCQNVISHAIACDSVWEEIMASAEWKGQNPYKLDAETFRVLTVLSTLRLGGILESLFSPNTIFYFAREHNLSAGRGVGTANVEWALGAQLLSGG